MSDEKRQTMGTDRHKRGPMGGGPAGALSVPTEKAKDFKGTLKRIVRYFAPQKWKFMAAGLLAIVSTVFSIFGPKILGMATTKLAEGIMADYVFDFGYIGRIMIIMILLYAFSFLCGYIMSYIMAGVSQKTVFAMRNEVKEKLDRLPLKYFDGRTHGEILSRVTNDMDTIANTLQQSLSQLIMSVVTLAGILIMMLSISPLMTLIALVTLPLSAILTVLIARKSQLYFSKQQKALGKVNGHVEEMLTGHKIVKAFGHEKKSIAEFKELNEELYGAGWKAQFLSGIIMPALSLISNIGYVLVCVAGGILVVRRAVDLGDIQAFIQYMRQFTHPIIQTANIANIIQATIAGAERIFEILDEEEQSPDDNDARILVREDAKGEVCFEDVSFRYEDNIPLIDNMNIHVKPGQMVAIVGPTGAGKTTLVNLMLRFYELRGGRITIDGIDIAKIERGNLRGLFGMVLQDTWLYKGTIMENIGYSLGDAEPEKIVEAAKAAYADHFIRSLPEGYDTILNEEASNISQGQRQLLTIARAILADPPIMILDEATSSVDTRTELLIQKGMGELMKERTSFVIAHRLSTIKNADLILVMKDGSVIEQGTHEELINKKGFYEDLYYSQFAV
ncbi:MAG: ABC transporter ATP-binding protein [Eubacteriales bacterium]|nr:ABC transporter ATP-binding protein [Eubacteriales bacterium]